MKKVKDIMNKNLRIVYTTTLISELVGLFTEGGFTGAPVVDYEGRLVGLISCTDVARHWVDVSRGRGPHAASEFTVQEVMTPFLFDVSPEDPVDKMVDMMCAGGIHRMVVTDDGVPVGIVTSMDLIKDYRGLLD